MNMCMYSKETQEKAKELRIIDDALFRLIAEREGVCQEILRTLLEDELEVISVTVQATMPSLERSVILDVLCKLSDGTLCNIEMQKADRDNDIKRVRFHASIITANKTPKGKDFKDIPTVKILYITEYDALENGQTLTHVSRCQNINGVYASLDDGEDIVFANTEVKDGTKQTELLQLFLRKDSFQNEDYPKLSDAMHHFKDTEEGLNEMCASIESYATDKALDRSISTCIRVKLSKDATVQAIKEEFPEYDDEQIISRITLLWNQKKN